MADVTLSDKLQKIASEIEKLTVVEVADLAKYLEEKFGVTAVAAVAAPAAGGAAAGAPAEEKTTFTVVLTDAGANKLNVIKTVREVKPELGLMDAKKLVETAGSEVLTDVKEEAKKKLEAAGAKVTLK